VYFQWEEIACGDFFETLHGLPGGKKRGFCRLARLSGLTASQTLVASGLSYAAEGINRL
jgi:hypothetical protein